jgi:hypothetical protein
VPASATLQNVNQTSTILQLVAGDYIEVIVYQNSGTTADINAGASYYNGFSVAYLGA